MKTIRKDWPKVRHYVKKGNPYYQVDLRRKHYEGPEFKNFTSRDRALAFASDIAEKVAKQGLNSLAVMTEDKRVTAWAQQCAVYGKTVEDVVKAGLEVFEKERKVKESPYIAGLLTVWVDDKITNTLKPLRPASMKAIRNMAEIFKKEFGMARIKEIDKERIESFLKERDVTNLTKRNLLNYLGQFYNWSVMKGYHTENPTDKIVIQVEAGVPEHFDVEQSIAIMKESAKVDNKHMTAYFALCLFGGIRPEETERLTWANIKMDTREIFLPASITKTRRARMFVMTDNLHEWLKSCDNTKQLVPAANIKNHCLKIRKQLSFPWIQDGMRHTFATFHYAENENLEKLRAIMGNSPAIIERFYKGVIPKIEVSKFWNIRPSNILASAA